MTHKTQGYSLSAIALVTLLTCTEARAQVRAGALLGLSGPISGTQFSNGLSSSGLTISGTGFSAYSLASGAQLGLALDTSNYAGTTYAFDSVSGTLYLQKEETDGFHIVSISSGGSLTDIATLPAPFKIFAFDPASNSLFGLAGLGAFELAGAAGLELSGTGFFSFNLISPSKSPASIGSADTSLYVATASAFNPATSTLYLEKQESDGFHIVSLTLHAGASSAPSGEYTDIAVLPAPFKMFAFDPATGTLVGIAGSGGGGFTAAGLTAAGATFSRISLQCLGSGGTACKTDLATDTSTYVATAAAFDPTSRTLYLERQESDGFHIIGYSTTGEPVDLGAVASEFQIFTVLKLALVDPVSYPTSSSDVFISNLLSNGSLTSDTELLATQGLPVSGMATDGVARLVLRFSAPGPGTVTFTLVDSGGNQLPSNIENGQLQDMQAHAGAVITTPTTLTSRGNKAFAVLTAPSQFVRCSTPGLVTCTEAGTPNAQDAAAFQRAEYIDVQFTPTGESMVDFGPAAVNLIRPMVFLVHGIWADASSWDNFQLNPANALFYVQRADYRSTNDQHFAVNAPLVYEQLTQYINQFRLDHSVAAIQADVVVHSMGAPIVRTMALPTTLQGAFLNDPNFPTFGAGPIRKLITIAGVHEGSPLANNLLLNSTPPGTPQIPFAVLDTILLASQRSPLNGAVADLSVMSPALQAINASNVQTPFPVHTIVGVADASSV